MTLTVRSVVSSEALGSRLRADDPLERLECLLATLKRLCSRPEGPEHEQRHRLGLGGREGAECPYPHLLPFALRALRFVGLHHRPRGTPGDLVVGAEEEGFLVGVQLVEGRPGDAGQLRDVEDADGPVSATSDQLDHRGLQSFALVALDLLGVQSVRPGGQAPVAVGSACV